MIKTFSFCKRKTVEQQVLEAAKRLCPKSFAKMLEICKKKGISEKDTEAIIVNSWLEASYKMLMKDIERTRYV